MSSLATPDAAMTAGVVDADGVSDDEGSSAHEIAITEKVTIGVSGILDASWLRGVRIASATGALKATLMSRENPLHDARAAATTASLPQSMEMSAPYPSAVLSAAACSERAAAVPDALMAVNFAAKAGGADASWSIQSDVRSHGGASHGSALSAAPHGTRTEKIVDEETVRVVENVSRVAAATRRRACAEEKTGALITRLACVARLG